jgi:glycosyltransferase involved in cell wall biosynthesis
VLRGWDRYTVGLVRALAAQGVEVTLLARESEPVHPANVARTGCSVLLLPGRGGLWWEQRTLPRALRSGRFDLYHAPAEHGVPLLAPCPVVLTLHSATEYSYADFIRRGLLPGRLADYLGYEADPAARTPANLYWRAQVTRADRIIAPSAFAAEEIVRLLGSPAARVHPIPLAVDDDFRKPARSGEALDAALAALGARRPYVLYVGGYERHKNVAGTLDAFAALRAQRRDLSLVLVGSRPPGADMARHAEALGLRAGGDVVWLTGLGEELRDLYDGAELFLSLSWRESFGLPALEAMTRGVAVVASAWGAAPEVVGDGGRLVDPRDTKGAADAALALLADPGRSDRARRAAARFDWPSVAERTLAVYRAVLNR